mmetsp:Transcript_25440/g.43386  ORF Transcript_25440/g.43386 Transcript_25440/m.43386 type:complete len:223 (+) Transcript_25440:737-1405(+)
MFALDSTLLMENGDGCCQGFATIKEQRFIADIVNSIELFAKSFRPVPHQFPKEVVQHEAHSAGAVVLQNQDYSPTLERSTQGSAHGLLLRIHPHDHSSWTDAVGADGSGPSLSLKRKELVPNHLRLSEIVLLHYLIKALFEVPSVACIFLQLPHYIAVLGRTFIVFCGNGILHLRPGLQHLLALVQLLHPARHFWDCLARIVDHFHQLHDSLRLCVNLDLPW